LFFVGNDAITKVLVGGFGSSSLLKHYNNLVQGIFDTSSLILLVTLFWVSFSPLNQLMLCDFSVHD